MDREAGGPDGLGGCNFDFFFLGSTIIQTPLQKNQRAEPDSSVYGLAKANSSLAVTVPGLQIRTVRVSGPMIHVVGTVVGCTP